MNNMPSDKFIQDTIDEIFSRPEFAGKESLLNKIIDYIGKLLSKINFNASSPYSWLSVLVIGLVILTVLAAVIYFTARAAAILYEKRYSQKSQHTAASGFTATLNGKQALELAHASCTRGLYTDAVRYMFLYLLNRLYELGYIRLSENRTNYQYINEMAENSYPRLALMKAASYEYEKIVYGGVGINAAEYDKWCRKIALLTEGVERQ